MVFGPHPRSYEQRLPKRMKRARAARRLTAKFGDGAIRVVDELGLDAPKTRDLVGFLDALKANGRVLVVATGSDANLELSARNLPQVIVIRADSLNVVDVLNADTLLITQPSLEKMARGVRMTLRQPRSSLRPVISEKSMDETQRGKYTFRVHIDANKLQVKDAIEELFKVDVLTVNVSTKKAKEKSRNRGRGRDRGLDLAVEEGRRHAGRRPEDRILRGGVVRCRCEATSPPRPAAGS